MHERYEHTRVQKKMSLLDHFKRKRPLEKSNDPSGKKSRQTRLNPKRIVSFNANGLASRLFNNMESIQEMLTKEDPDVICIQECKLAAHCDNPKAKRDDGHPRRRDRLSSGTKKQRETSHGINRALRRGKLCEYDIHWSLSDWKYAGTAILIKKNISVISKKYSIPTAKPSSATKHHKEGRVMIFEFEKFVLMNTYAPNNGWDEKSFDRRRSWDSSLLRAMESGFANSYNHKPVIWVGDLNVCKADADASDIEFYRHGIYEYDKKYSVPIDPDDKGQPGCTRNEQKRFHNICMAGNLIDTYRIFHPIGSDVGSDTQWSWRGSPPRNFATARYYGKGMRIDYTLVDKRLVENVKRSEILGRGKDRHGFLGSDHCPILIELDWHSHSDSSSGNTLSSDGHAQD